MPRTAWSADADAVGVQVTSARAAAAAGSRPLFGGSRTGRRGPVRVSAGRHRGRCAGGWPGGGAQARQHAVQLVWRHQHLARLRPRRGSDDPARLQQVHQLRGRGVPDPHRALQHRRRPELAGDDQLRGPHQRVDIGHRRGSGGRGGARRDGARNGPGRATRGGGARRVGVVQAGLDPVGSRGRSQAHGGRQPDPIHRTGRVEVVLGPQHGPVDHDADIVAARRVDDGDVGGVGVGDRAVDDHGVADHGVADHP